MILDGGAHIVSPPTNKTLNEGAQVSHSQEQQEEEEGEKEEEEEGEKEEQNEKEGIGGAQVNKEKQITCASHIFSLDLVGIFVFLEVVDATTF